MSQPELTRPAAHTFVLMRRSKLSGELAPMAMWSGRPTDWQVLWNWVGGERGVSHPHPLSAYWVEAVDEPARLIPEDHLILSEN